MWTWGIVLVLAGATLHVFWPDFYAALREGTTDPLIMYVGEYVVAIAQFGLMPAGAMVIVAAILHRAIARSSDPTGS